MVPSAMDYHLFQDKLFLCNDSPSIVNCKVLLFFDQTVYVTVMKHLQNVSITTLYIPLLN